METKIISKSNKKRGAGLRSQPREGISQTVERRGEQKHWKQVVVIEEIGKRKGKTIYKSRTKHVPA